MKGACIGYVRVSSSEQNTERQLVGVKLDKIFTDRLSGKNAEREQLHAMLDYVREGDRIIVHSLDRLARNLDDLRNIVRCLTARGVAVEFMKENLVFTGDDSPMSNLLLSVMGAFAEFERSLIRERQREGIELAKLKGKYKGRKKSLNAEQRAELFRRIKAGEAKSKLAQEYGISRETLYKYMREPVVD